LSPQPKRTNGGEGFCFESVLGSGTRQPNSASTSADTSALDESLASRNSSRVSVRGCEPVNSGTEAWAAPLVLLRFQSALFWTEYSLGLNLQVTRLLPATLAAPPGPDLAGSRNSM
jgi:hypothetical protein